MPLLTPELIARIEAFHLAFNRARMEAVQALPGNPYEVEIQPFGSAVAFRSRSPLLWGKNRILNFRAEDAPSLLEGLAFFRNDGLRCSISVCHGAMNQELFAQFCEAGLWSAGSGTIPVCVPDTDRKMETESPELPALHIRESGLDERDAYLDLFRQAFAIRSEGQADYMRFQWAEDTLPGCRRYIAEWEGHPVAMASFPVLDGVGYFGTAGVLPNWRGRGIQAALIRRRIGDAPALGCNLIVGGGSLFSPPHRNFERAGLRLVPMGTGWIDTRV